MERDRERLKLPAPTTATWKEVAADLRALLSSAECGALVAEWERGLTAANREKYAWNFRFIAALEVKDPQERNRALSSYDEDFRRAAEQHCRTIVSELAVADSARKTIKPVSLGGVAGGMKFIHNGILFKFPQVIVLRSTTSFVRIL